MPARRGRGATLASSSRARSRRGALVVTVVGGVHHLLDETDHERNGDGLVATGRDDVQLMRSSKELLDVEWRLARRRAGGLGANAGEESRGGRPDARSFTLLGRQHAAQERDRRGDARRGARLVRARDHRIVARQLATRAARVTRHAARTRASTERLKHPLARSNGHHFVHLDHVARRQEGSAQPKQRHPKLKIVLEVNIPLDAHRVVFRLFLTDRRATLHHRDARAPSMTRHHSSLMSLRMNHVVIRRFGTMIEVVFPLRVGPNTSVERSSPLVASPCAPRPK